MRWALALLSLLACSGGSGGGPPTTRAECDAISADIREAAAKRSPPLNPEGVCNSTDAQVQKDFGDACDKLRDCNARCCK